MHSSTATRRSWRTISLNLVKVLFLVAVVVAGVLFAINNWADLAAAFTSMNPWWLVGALVAVCAGLISSMLSWLALWPAFGAKLGIMAGARVYFISQLGKYLPGSVWTIAAQAQMSRDIGVKRTASVGISLIALLNSVATGLAFGLAILPLANPGLVGRYWWLIPIGLLLLSLLMPPVVKIGLKLGLGVLRQPTLAPMYSWRVVLRSCIAQVCNWIFSGIQLWLVLVALGQDPVRLFLPSIAAFALACALGILLIPFPAGVGVREVVISIALTGLVAPEIAVLAAVVSRALFAVADFGLAAATGAIRRPRLSEIDR
jgi:uncharacterized membrane protein YbhN (UPF0104 family)